MSYKLIEIGHRYELPNYRIEDNNSVLIDTTTTIDFVRGEVEFESKEDFNKATNNIDTKSLNKTLPQREGINHLDLLNVIKDDLKLKLPNNNTSTNIINKFEEVIALLSFI